MPAAYYDGDVLDEAAGYERCPDAELCPECRSCCCDHLPALRFDEVTHDRP